MIEGFKTVSTIAEEWGISERTVQIMCAEGKIPGATKFGRSWAIPIEAQRPGDGRIISGQYKNWRKRGKDL